MKVLAGLGVMALMALGIFIGNTDLEASAEFESTKQWILVIQGLVFGMGSAIWGLYTILKWM